MNKDTEQILRDAKKLLKIEDGSEDEVLMLLAEDCISSVLAYCRIDILPYQLFGFVARMTAKKYEQEIKSGSGGGLINSVTEGDRRIDFGVPNIITEEYAQRLKPFINRKGRLPSQMKNEEEKS